jgi:hydrogenase nickel incorporation protein HypA/HybF
MHELSIMTSIMDIVLEEASKVEATVVERIALDIGKRSGVVIDALEFAFEIATKGSIAQKAVLVINSIPFKGECLSCGNQFISEDFLICDKCGAFGKIISGQELQIRSIEVK